MTRVMTLALLLLLAPPAWADVLPIYDAPHQLACKRQKVGDACTFQGADKKTQTGTCVERKECSVNATAQHYYEQAMRDYKPTIPEPGSDMSPPEPPMIPKETCYSFLECKPGATQAAPVKAPDTKKTSDTSEPNTSTDSRPEPSKTKASSCASTSGPSLPAPALILLGLLGLLVARPKRRS